MCGIAGWYNWYVPEIDRLTSIEAMCDAMEHRGPDDAGYFITETAALGMRRLSIVDIEGGHQPMTSDDRRFTLVMNGEIFNHKQLRRQLQAKGVKFRTRSDTEVLLQLYLTHGMKAFNLCNGMFAAAIWDAHERSLRIVRDRMGVKPLYYYWDGSKLLFGSELKTLIASGAFTPEINQEALWHYLTFRYVPSFCCIWKHVHKLPPAHSLSITGSSAEPHISRWWDIPYEKVSRKENDAIFDSEFAELMDDAVNLRMLADVPVGILLSGGLDSSVVAALAQRHATTSIKTFSVAFEGAGTIDERPFARQVARHLGTDHHEIVVDKKSFCDFLPRMTWFSDEPLADLASVPLYYVCNLAAEEVKVVLSGEGSDEIFAGYNFEVWAQRWNRQRSGLGRLLDVISPLSQEDLRTWPEPLNMTNTMNCERKHTMLRQSGTFSDSFAPARAHLQRLGQQHPLHQALYLYCQDWLVEDLLMKADRMSMAASIELRTPFLDYRVVEWAARLPAKQKAGRNLDGTWGNKRILRRLASDLLPQTIIDRPKMGFPVPVYDWLASELKDFAHDMLGSSPHIDNWLTQNAINETLRQGTAANASMAARHELWHLLILELWARTWNC